MSVAQDPTFAAQTSNSPLEPMFNALHSLLQVFNLQSFIGLPGHSDASSESTAWSLLTILVIGLTAEVVRRSLDTHHIFEYLSELFYITVSFDEHDPCYEWVLAWLSKQPKWKTIRTVSISTTVTGGHSGHSRHNGGPRYYEPMTPHNNDNMNSTQTIYTIPEVDKFYWIRTSQGYWVSICRKRQEAAYGMAKMENILHLRIITIKDATVLYDLIHEARQAYIESMGEKISIFTPEPNGWWRCASTCTKRSLSSVILEKSVKDKVISDTKEFLKSRSWYTDRGIPYRRGYLFYGKPGTGKTSFINALAGELGLDIYNMSPSGIDDSTLANLISQIPEKALLLMEDIDAAFIDPGVNRGNQQNKAETGKSITLSGLLNVLDGVGAGEGRILVATTNYYDRLDEALRRPGRIDLEVEFELATKYQAREQFCQFYVPQITTKETEAGIILAKAKSQELDEGKDEEKHFENKDLNPDDLEFAAKFSRLADQFAENFQEHVISSASLQEYLLMYKTGPTEAVVKFKAWVEAQVEKREHINQTEGAKKSVPKHQGNDHAADTVLGP